LIHQARKSLKPIGENQVRGSAAGRREGHVPMVVEFIEARNSVSVKSKDFKTAAKPTKNMGKKISQQKQHL
jgi:hypothetical protein